MVELTSRLAGKRVRVIASTYEALLLNRRDSVLGGPSRHFRENASAVCQTGTHSRQPLPVVGEVLECSKDEHGIFIIVLLVPLGQYSGNRKLRSLNKIYEANILTLTQV
jgi:hypothetical protein